MKYETNDSERHLVVFEDRSEYHAQDGSIAVFAEGVVSPESRKRTIMIKKALESGYLDERISKLKTGEVEPNSHQVSDMAQENLKGLAEGMTSEVGRALVGLTVMQLTIKSITPHQNIRLHKGGASKSAFSWVEGISMRTLDKNYVTPVLRKHDLVRLNADGFMMTRSLAENYPYSLLYKAKLRGARENWLRIVEEIETGNTNPSESLNFFLSLLINQADGLVKLANKLVCTYSSVSDRFSSRQEAMQLMTRHSEASTYAARLMEIAMHSLGQACVQSGALGDLELKKLSQMRSANKKHGNIGDIEFLELGEIVESWDAKYGKGYLREELEEAAEKIKDHEMVEVVGFVTDSTVERSSELDARIEELEDLKNVKFEIVNFKTWVDRFYERCLADGFLTEQELSAHWCQAYVESLAQKRRDVAPIDEPCLQWIESLQSELQRL